MSELINNESLRRREILKSIILKLHAGGSFEEAFEEFSKHFTGVSTEEISKLEHELVEEGLPVEEIVRLCNVHAALLGKSVSDIHSLSSHAEIKGHPVQVLVEENEKIEKLLKEEIDPYMNEVSKHNDLMLRVGFDRLLEIDKHYQRKENLMFPYLEKAGILVPPQVMWAVDDEIRDAIKEVIKTMSTVGYDSIKIREVAKYAVDEVREMIFKENNILIPLLVDKLTFMDWVEVDKQTPEIGYFLGKPKYSWVKDKLEKEEEIEAKDGEIPFDAGVLTFLEANQILNTIPFDMTFIDKEGHVKYFTQGEERIFPRPKTIIGRHVNMCHPPSSVHVVEKIVNSFKSGEKDFEDFWINNGKVFILIRYFAIRDKEGNYLGTLELSQNLKPLRELEGEKRILEEK